MSRSTVKVLQIVVILVALVIIAVLMFANRKSAATVVLFVWLGVQMFFNYLLRCPNCGAWPGRYSFFQQYCPRCGEPLE